jgi:glucokinase
MRSAIGIDIGGTKIRAARVSETGEILAEAVHPTATAADSVIAQADALIAALDGADVAAIGVGVPGRVDVATGVVLSGGYVDFAGVALGQRLGGSGKRRVFIDNDANMALAAEARIGAASGLRHAVLLTIGTGIGGAILDRGRIVRGRAAAGQLGHIATDINGPACICGRQGCLETMSSGTALGRLIAAAGLPASTAAGELLQCNDAAALAIVDAWARPLRAGIDSLVAAFDPQRVILGGGLGSEACTALGRFPAPSPWFQCDVAPARLGGRAGVTGAALAALEFAT